MRIVPFLLSLILFLPLRSSSQSSSEASMYADFDYLTTKILTCHPYLEIKEKLFAYSISDSLSQLRKKIANCTSDEDFQKIIRQALNTCVDGHCVAFTPPTNSRVNLFLPLVYQHGNYYLKRAFNYHSQVFPAGAKLVSINENRDIHEIVAQQVPHRYLMRFDLENGRFYSEQFYLSEYFIAHGSISLGFEYENQMLSDTFSFSDTLALEPFNLEDRAQVRYLSGQNILYIRVPSMEWGLHRYFRKEIPRIARGKAIDKVVVDVRHNMGGSSLVGRSIFRSILKDTVNFHIRLFGKHPQIASARYLRQHGLHPAESVKKLPELDSIALYGWQDALECIRPYRSSIQHDGPVFILGNEHIYSAGGAIFMFAQHSGSNQIYSVGTPTGWFLGEFTDPLTFTLPSSGYRFRIAPTMSLTDVYSLRDAMLDHYDFEIFPNTQDYEKYYGQKGSLYLDDYLLHADPYMKVVLQAKE